MVDVARMNTGGIPIARRQKGGFAPYHGKVPEQGCVLVSTGRPPDPPTFRSARSMTVQDTQTVQETPTGVNLTDIAATKVKTLLEQEGRDDLALRIAVQPGGCSGLRYQLFFDERRLDGDAVLDFGGVNVVVDRMSSPYLGGATIDFVDTIEKQGFTIDNPNAAGSCACGDSFH
jgi:iron-sulfur cluster assembly accessory protein